MHRSRQSTFHRSRVGLAALAGAMLAAAGPLSTANGSPVGANETLVGTSRVDEADLMPAARAYVQPGLTSAVEAGPVTALITIRSSDLLGAARRTAATAEAQATSKLTGQAARADSAFSLRRTAANKAYLASARGAFAARKVNIEAGHADIEVGRDFTSLPVIEVKLDSPTDITKLAADPGIESVTIPEIYTKTADPDLKLIGQSAVEKLGDDGAGTSVAVLDTGLDYTKSTSVFGTCPGSGCAVPVDRDFAPDDHSLDGDDDLHGTNVASLVRKVAPKTKVIAGDVFSGKQARQDDIMAGLQFVADNAAAFNIKAVNLSLGGETRYTSACSDSPYVAIFSTLIDLGVQPVVAAGNSAFQGGKYVDGVSSPACAPGAFVVGAVYDGKHKNLGWGQDNNVCNDAKAVADQPTCFSQGGALVDVMAPGSFESGGSGIPKLSGTSQATPHVAGAIAALASGDPADSSAVIASVIRSAGHPITDSRSGVSVTVPRLDLVSARAALRHGAIISNGEVQLGVNDLADLNVENQRPDSLGNTTFGLRLIGPGLDDVAPGCPCEGWGVADTDSGISGYADEASGRFGLTAAKFTHSEDEAKSVVIAGGQLEVTHKFHATDATDSLFQVDVSIKNIGSDTMKDVVYRRLVDWDMPPTTFSELVTIQSGNASKIRFTSDNGFASANPLSPGNAITFTGNATRNGPADHGALFDLGLGQLKAGSSTSFKLYYGAALDEARAIEALKAVKAEAYSLGEPQRADDATQGAPQTAILAFTKIGGKAIKF